MLESQHKMPMSGWEADGKRVEMCGGLARLSTRRGVDRTGEPGFTLTVTVDKLMRPPTLQVVAA